MKRLTVFKLIIEGDHELIPNWKVYIFCLFVHEKYENLWMSAAHHRKPFFFFLLFIIVVFRWTFVDPRRGPTFITHIFLAIIDKTWGEHAKESERGPFNWDFRFAVLLYFWLFIYAIAAIPNSAIICHGKAHTVCAERIRKLENICIRLTFTKLEIWFLGNKFIPTVEIPIFMVPFDGFQTSETFL